MTVAAGFSVRRPVSRDAEAVAAIAIAFELAHQGYAEATAADVRGDWHEVDLRSDAWLVEDASGRVVGYVDLRRRGVDRFDADGYVHPDSRGRGVGTTLIELTEERARALGAAALNNTVHGADGAARSLLEHAGYRDARHFYRMLIELDRPPPEPVWPPGLTVQPFDRADSRVVHAALEEVFAREWGFRPYSFEEFEERHLADDRFDPAASTVVKDGDAVAGLARAGMRVAWEAVVYRKEL